MKLIITISVLCIGFFSMAQDNSTAITATHDSVTRVFITSAKSKSYLKRLCLRKMRLLNTAFGIQVDMKSFMLDGSQDVKYSNGPGSEFLISKQIQYDDSCGHTPAKIELVIKLKQRKRKNEIYAHALHLARDYQLVSMGLYMPRCDEGRHNINSLNLIWVKANGEVLRIP